LISHYTCVYMYIEIERSTMNWNFYVLDFVQTKGILNCLPGLWWINWITHGLWWVTVDYIDYWVELTWNVILAATIVECCYTKQPLYQTWLLFRVGCGVRFHCTSIAINYKDHNLYLWDSKGVVNIPQWNQMTLLSKYRLISVLHLTIFHWAMTT
jgi:hypothetical protein